MCAILSCTLFFKLKWSINVIRQCTHFVVSALWKHLHGFLRDSSLVIHHPTKYPKTLKTNRQACSYLEKNLFRKSKLTTCENKLHQEKKSSIDSICIIIAIMLSALWRASWFIRDSSLEESSLACLCHGLGPRNHDTHHLLMANRATRFSLQVWDVSSGLTGSTWGRYSHCCNLKQEKGHCIFSSFKQAIGIHSYILFTLQFMLLKKKKKKTILSTITSFWQRSLYHRSNTLAIDVLTRVKRWNLSYHNYVKEKMLQQSTLRMIYDFTKTRF